MTMTLRVVRGPLTDAELESVGQTYGRVDPRYRSVGFCRTLFNQNPFGFSWHAFVSDGGTVVGHYAVIPFRVVVKGEQRVSGKGEALFLAESHRTALIHLQDGPVPVGLALICELHDHVLEQEICVLHNITSRDVGMLQRMSGFTCVKVVRDQLHLLIDPSHFPSTRTSRAKVLAARCLADLQRRASILGTAVSTWGRAPELRVTPTRDLPAPLRTPSPADPWSLSRWGISRDAATLQWLLDLGRIEFLSIAAAPDRFAMVSRGAVREMLQWAVPPGAWKDGLALMRSIVNRSRQEGAALVSVDRRLLDRHPDTLRSAVRLLGLVPRQYVTELYVKSGDSFFRDPDTIAFDRLFYLSGGGDRWAGSAGDPPPEEAR